MHERLCLAQVGPRRWIMATPHFDVYEEDLDEYASVYPVGKLGGIDSSLLDRDRVKFKNDELRTRLSALLVDGEADAQGLREPNFVPNGPGSASREARGTSAAALGATPNLRAFSNVNLVVPEPQSIWVAMEAAGGFKVGDVVPHAANMPCIGDRGLYVLPGTSGASSASIAVGRVGTVAVPAAPAPAVDDMRTMAVKYKPGQGTDRGRSFADGVANALEHSFPDWPLEGPRTCQWLLSAFVSSDTTPCRRHFWWRSILGLGASDEGVEEHEFLSELLELSMAFDQVNSPDLVVFEHISRRFQLWEEIYSDQLRDNSAGTHGQGGLDTEERSLYLGRKASPSAALVSPALQTWVSTRVAERSAILKERRKGREERRLAIAHSPPDNAATPAGKDKRGGKAKAKGKEGS